MLRRGTLLLISLLPMRAQDTTIGLNVPITVSGDAIYTKRLQSNDPNAFPASEAFRTVFYPELQLGSHWFGYAAIQVSTTPYFYYDAYSPERKLETDILQAFLGYSLHKGKMSAVFKVGRLTTAFGGFPLRYDDASNPLLDQPLAYTTELRLRSAPGSDGIIPVTLTGMYGSQAEVSSGRVDARLQLTGSSPTDPLRLRDARTSLQWTAGGGFTIRQGFRVGVSGFRGPYLDPSVAPLLPIGTTIRTFPASAIGVDVQWARGGWSTNSEVQRFRFDSPDPGLSSSITTGYVEAKRIITPRFYLAGRAGWLSGGVEPHLESYEIVAGYWLTRNQLVKAGYEALKLEGQPGTKSNVLGLQYVVSVRSLAWAFR